MCVAARSVFLWRRKYGVNSFLHHECRYGKFFTTIPQWFERVWVQIWKLASIGGLHWPPTTSQGAIFTAMDPQAIFAELVFTILLCFGKLILFHLAHVCCKRTIISANIELTLSKLAPFLCKIVCFNSSRERNSCVWRSYSKSWHEFLWPTTKTHPARLTMTDYTKNTAISEVMLQPGGKALCYQTQFSRVYIAKTTQSITLLNLDGILN